MLVCRTSDFLNRNFSACLASYWLCKLIFTVHFERPTNTTVRQLGTALRVRSDNTLLNYKISYSNHQCTRSIIFVHALLVDRGAL